MRRRYWDCWLWIWVKLYPVDVCGVPSSDDAMHACMRDQCCSLFRWQADAVAGARSLSLSPCRLALTLTSVRRGEIE